MESKPACFRLLLIFIGFVFGTIIAASVFLTLHKRSSDIKIGKNDIVTTIIVAGLTGMLITVVTLALHHLYKLSTQASKNDKKISDDYNVAMRCGEFFYGFVYGLIIAASVFLTLKMLSSDIKFDKNDIDTAIIAAGLTGMLITVFSLALYNLYKRLTQYTEYIEISDNDEANSNI